MPKIPLFVVATPIPLLDARTVLHIRKKSKSVSQTRKERKFQQVFLPISNETQIEGVKLTMEHWWSVDGSLPCRQ